MTKFWLVSASVFALSACGGGGSSDYGTGTLAELSSSYAKQGKNTHQVLREYTSGDSIMAFKGNFKTSNSSGKTFYVFSITKDQQTIIDTFDGAINFTTSNYNDFDGTSYYYYEGAGTNANGQAITSEHLGFFNGNVDVGGIYAVVGGHENLMSLGDVPGDLPAGVHTYANGDTRILYRGDVEDSYDKSTLVANFDTKTGSLLAETNTLFMSATNFNINTTTGEISGGTAKVGNLNNPTDFVSAKLLGAFSGKFADGVHGIIYQETDSTSGVPGSGVFYAINNRLFE